MSYFLLGPLGWKLHCLWLRGFLRVLQGLDAGGGGSTAAVLCTPGWGSSCFRSDVMYWISAMAAKDQVYPFSGKSGGFERVHKLGIYIYYIVLIHSWDSAGSHQVSCPSQFRWPSWTEAAGCRGLKHQSTLPNWSTPTKRMLQLSCMMVVLLWGCSAFSIKSWSS